MKTILITGGNRGIGFEICRQLGALGHQVILAARNNQKGSEASAKLRDEGFNITFMALDLEEKASIKTFVIAFSNAYERLDVLINNAAILLDSRYGVSNISMDLFERMMTINLHGPVLLTQALLSLLRKSSDPRVINISSGMGALSEMSGGNPAYRISKAAINAFTRILAAEESGIQVNSVCPGWVRTDMGGSAASRSVEKGAETPVWLATAEKIPSGKFLRDKKVINW